METEAEELSKASQSPLGNIRRKHHILTPRQSEKALHLGDSQTTQRTKKSKLGGLVNWFKKSEQQSTDDPFDLQDNNGESFTTETASFIRQSSKTHLSTAGKANKGVGQTIQKAKRRMEDKFKFVLKKGKKKDGSMEDTGGGCNNYYLV